MLCLNVGAQTAKDRYPVYCVVMGYNFWGVGKVKVELDMGKYANTKGFDSIYEEDGKKKRFNTMMAVLNFMGERGWKCVGTYYVTVSKSHVVHYLMEKMVTSKEEITEGLLLREDTEPVRKEKRKKRREDVESGKIDPMFY